MARTPRERNRVAADNLTAKPATKDQQARIDAITKAAISFARVVIKNTDDTPESTLAQRDIERAKRQAVAAVFVSSSDAPAVPAKATRAVKTAAPVKKVGVKRRSAA